MSVLDSSFFVNWRRLWKKRSFMLVLISIAGCDVVHDSVAFNLTLLKPHRTKWGRCVYCFIQNGSLLWKSNCLLILWSHHFYGFILFSKSKTGNVAGREGWFSIWILTRIFCLLRNNPNTRWSWDDWQKVIAVIDGASQGLHTGTSSILWILVVFEIWQGERILERLLSLHLLQNRQ